jgi:hypothetical protein
MRRLLASLALLISLMACAPAADLIAPQCPSTYQCKRLETGWSVVADASSPGFVIGASADITGVSSTAPCKLRSVVAGQKRALECNAPNRVVIDMRGEIQVSPLEAAPLPPPNADVPLPFDLAMLELLEGT